MKSTKILIGKKALIEFLEVSEPLLDKLIGLGLPIGIINNRMYAHVDNIEKWFEKNTFRKNLNLSENEDPKNSVNPI